MSKIKEEQKNNNFIQFNRNRMAELRILMMENPTAAALFNFLAEHMDSKNVVVASDKALEEALNKKRTSIYRAKKLLIDKGYIQIMRIGTGSAFVLNPDIVWSSWRTNKRYCVFEGNVIISKEENKEMDEKIEASYQKQINLN